MKEIYAWVPYYRELARKVALNGERHPHLIEAAKEVKSNQKGSQSPLLKYGDQNIDPFSFFYTLAAYSTKSNRKRIYRSLSRIYDMESKLPIDVDEAFQFPKALKVNTLFHNNGQGNPKLLWQLFRSAVSGWRISTRKTLEALSKLAMSVSRN